MRKETQRIDLRCLKPAAAAAKLGRKTTWLYEKLKSDATFPRPVTLGDKSGPVFLEHELDEWLSARIAQQRNSA